MNHLSAELIKGNESFNGTLTATQMAEIEGEVALCVHDMLSALRIRPDHNTESTPARVARMLVREIFAGRYEAPPEVTDFPNVTELDQVYAVGPIAFRSCCAHHLVPILGQAWIGVLPGTRLIGLSKFHRLTHWIMARPQIQEEATQQLADTIDVEIEPKGLGVIIRAKHFCTAWRGVRDEPSMMTTSVMRGVFREEPEAKAEFMSLIAAMGFAR
jgi:GTP cyclohydrolase I